MSFIVKVISTSNNKKNLYFKCFWNPCVTWVVRFQLKSIVSINITRFYHLQTKFAKVMFLHVSVILSGGGVSQHALQVSRPTPKGEVEGSGRGGCLLRGGAYSVGGLPAMATAAGGTHPTGMHSCLCVCTLGPIH